MDRYLLEKRYSRYLRLIEEIKAGIEARYPSSQLVVHENDDWLVVNSLGSAPGEIFLIRRSRERIQLFDRTACRAGEKDWDTIGLIDLDSEHDDQRLVEDFFYSFVPAMKDAVSRQKRWWEVQKLKMAAEDGYDEDELDD